MLIISFALQISSSDSSANKNSAEKHNFGQIQVSFPSSTNNTTEQ